MRLSRDTLKRDAPSSTRGEYIKDDKHVFKHVLEFPCVKEPATGGAKEAFYAMHHLKGFVRDCQNLTLPSSFRAWAENLVRRAMMILEKTSIASRLSCRKSSWKMSTRGEGS